MKSILRRAGMTAVILTATLINPAFATRRIYFLARR